MPRSRRRLPGMPSCQREVVADRLRGSSASRPTGAPRRRSVNWKTSKPASVEGIRSLARRTASAPPSDGGDSRATRRRSACSGSRQSTPDQLRCHAERAPAACPARGSPSSPSSSRNARSSQECPPRTRSAPSMTARQMVEALLGPSRRSSTQAAMQEVLGREAVAHGAVEAAPSVACASRDATRLDEQPGGATGTGYRARCRCRVSRRRGADGRDDREQAELWPAARPRSNGGTRSTPSTPNERRVRRAGGPTRLPDVAHQLRNRPSARKVRGARLPNRTPLRSRRRSVAGPANR